MAAVTVQILDNGPILVTGDIALQDGSGNAIEVDTSKPQALCRCGASDKKPFCDGSHKSCGFESTVKAD